jgi:protein-disulfide isomerase
LTRASHVSAGAGSRKTHGKGLAAVITLGTLLILAAGLTSRAASQQAAATPTKTSTTPKSATPAKTAAHPKAESALGAPVKSYGSSSAPIVLEVFSDYECPVCRNFFEQTLRTMISETDYVSSGKVYVIHRDFPLAMHKYSGQAARWANAAARVGEFPNVDGALYDNQSIWQADGSMEKYVAASMSAADFKRVQAQMQGCEAPGPTSGATSTLTYPAGGRPCAIDQYIASDILLGGKVPVQATPTYVITYKGHRLPAGSGAVSWPILKQFFDSLLSQ